MRACVLAYHSTLEARTHATPKRRLTSTGLHVVITLSGSVCGRINGISDKEIWAWDLKFALYNVTRKSSGSITLAEDTFLWWILLNGVLQFTVCTAQ
jgi:hypothetical protein